MARLSTSASRRNRSQSRRAAAPVKTADGSDVPDDDLDAGSDKPLSALRQPPATAMNDIWEPPQAPIPVAASIKGAAAADDHLSFYFRDLAVHDLLDAAQERDLARGIERHELESWTQVLAQPAAALRALALVEPHLEQPAEQPVSFVALRKAIAAATGSKATAKARAKLAAVAADVAEQVRALDLDREHIDAVIRDLEKLRASGGTLPDLGAATFGTWLDDLRASHAAGARLRDHFVRANLRLVVTMARRYDKGGMPLPDLIQEGNLGLMHAVSRFDHRRGLRFSTYACWWIRHAIGRALADKARAVRIPVHMLEAQQQLEKVRQAQTRELGRPPTPQELAKAARVPLSKLNQMHRYLMGGSVSLDRPMHEDDDRAMGDLLADPASEEASPADDMTTSKLATQVSKMLHLLTPIEADVVRKRFGLKDDEERTFREIGDEYDLSRERIRQIQNTALDKLRRAMEREHRGHVEA
jgi:RNA polymerase primary sigma factor